MCDTFYVGKDIISNIPHKPIWPKCFSLNSTIEFVTICGFSQETFVSRLSKPLGDRLSHNVDSIGIIETDRCFRKP